MEGGSVLLHSILSSHSAYASQSGALTFPKDLILFIWWLFGRGSLEKVM